MIVEFIGPSGSGKTSLTHRVIERASAPEVRRAVDVALGPLAGLVHHPTGRNLVADVNAVLELPRLTSQHRRFMAYAWSQLGATEAADLRKLNYRRSILRRVGVDHACRRRHPETIVLADEGVLLVAYLLFVYGSGAFEGGDIDEFVAHAPLPDLVVHVSASPQRLKERASARSRPRRELADPFEADRSLRVASELFEALAGHERIRSRLVRVDNSGESLEELGPLVDRIVGALGRRPADDPRSTAA